MEKQTINKIYSLINELENKLNKKNTQNSNLKTYVAAPEINISKNVTKVATFVIKEEIIQIIIV